MLRHVVAFTAGFVLASPQAVAQGITPEEGRAHIRAVWDTVLETGVPAIAGPEACGVVSHLEAHLALEQIEQGMQAVASAYSPDGMVGDAVGAVEQARAETARRISPDGCAIMRRDPENVFEIRRDVDALGHLDGLSVVAGLTGR